MNAEVETWKEVKLKVTENTWGKIKKTASTVNTVVDAVGTVFDEPVTIPVDIAFAISDWAIPADALHDIGYADTGNTQEHVLHGTGHIQMTPKRALKWQYKRGGEMLAKEQRQFPTGYKYTLEEAKAWSREFNRVMLKHVDKAYRRGIDLQDYDVPTAVFLRAQAAGYRATGGR